jgi:hypothetical protein
MAGGRSRSGVDWLHQPHPTPFQWATLHPPALTHNAGKHLQSYFDEFVFRFNRRKTRHAAFSLLGIAVPIKHSTYKMLIRPEATA